MLNTFLSRRKPVTITIPKSYSGRFRKVEIKKNQFYQIEQAKNTLIHTINEVSTMISNYDNVSHYDSTLSSLFNCVQKHRDISSLEYDRENVLIILNKLIKNTHISMNDGVSSKHGKRLIELKHKVNSIL